MASLATIRFDTSSLIATALAHLDDYAPDLREAIATNNGALYDAPPLRSHASGGTLHTLSCRLMTMNIDGMSL